ncbi:class E sortase [Streptomyces spiralis]
MTALRPERESGADWYGSSEGYDAPADPYASLPYDTRDAAAPYAGSLTEETMGLRVPGPPPPKASGAPRSTAAATTDTTDTTAVTDGGATGNPPGTPGGPQGGRAARRKAARGRHGRQARTGRHGAGAHAAGRSSPGGDGTPGERPAAPLTRVEARRLARARRPSPGVVASRIIGEVFITTGVLMLLFVTYQLWWTNVRAHAQAGNEAHQLQNDWASGKRSPGAFEPGQGFAILHIPKLDVVVPIAEGTSKTKVLDKGMVGHYGQGDLNTAMPEAKTGNFGLAGHRNTHGEPFRYINRLKPGDPIVVETQDTYFVYKMTSMLPVTSPANTSVLDPVPKGSGFTGPGRYITLTTCTPEFTSKYRLIVWGKMVEERPRSKGKPDALVS